MHIPTPIIDALRQARHVTVFTGAGISAESGIATFRDKGTGLWQRFNPADLATPEAYLRDPALVWGWYESRRLQVSAAQPNTGHLAIVKLAKRVPSLSVVTQNVDDLHERAGSQNVLHLHGSLFAPRCFDCSEAYEGELCESAPDGPVEPPRCERCGGMVRPRVVWFGEVLPEEAIEAAAEATREADCFLSIGTSGLVQPAASFVGLALTAGAVVVHVNPDAVGGGAEREFALRGLAGEVLPELISILKDEHG